MKLYRIENAEGLGPYRRNYPNLWVEVSQEDTSHPLPEEDKRLSRLMKDITGDSYPSMYDFIEYYCGFESIEHIINWFTPKELSFLHEIRFRVVEYECDDVLLGNTQLIFKKDEAIQLKSKHIYDYKELEYAN